VGNLAHWFRAYVLHVRHDPRAVVSAALRERRGRVGPVRHGAPRRADRDTPRLPERVKKEKKSRKKRRVQRKEDFKEKKTSKEKKSPKKKKRAVPK
jgi:hypothetical protein